jgi:hypothetical protein
MSRGKHRVGHRIAADGYCSIVGKRGYATQDVADAALAEIRAAGRMGKGGRIETRSYECPWCGRWHLTSKAEEVS